MDEEIVTRDVVYPQKVWKPGLSSPVDLAPLIPALKQRMGEFKAAGIPVPFVWRHDDGAVPGIEAGLKLQQGDGRLSLGNLVDLDPDAEGVLVGKHKVPVPEDRTRLKATRSVSPWIVWDWKDGQGKVWKGPSILHVAVAPRPVQLQRPLKLSHDGGLQELYLSAADYEREADMPDEPMPEEKPKKESKKEIKAGDGFDKDILDCLAGYGINLPPDTDENNIFERIRIICHAKKDEGGGKKDEPQPVPNPETPMGLSHDQQIALARGERAEKALLTERKEKTRARVAALKSSGRVSDDIHKAMVATLDGGLKLALDDNGDLAKNDLLVEIAAYEKMPPGAAMGGLMLSPEDRAKVAASARPSHLEADGDGSKMNDKLMARMTGGRYKPGDNDIGAAD